MPRVTVTRERIIEAAMEVFTEKGYEGATTRAIAERARVNEVTLFRHFETKKNLLVEVMERYAALPEIERGVGGSFTGDVRKDLEAVGTRYLKSVLGRRRVILMTLCTAEKFPEIKPLVARAPYKLRGYFVRYISDLKKKGRMRDIDPDMAARAFVEMFFGAAVSLPLLEENYEEEIEVKRIVTRFVDIYLDGILAE